MYVVISRLFLIQKELNIGIDYTAGEITVIDLLKRYIGLKQGVRYNPKVGYNFVLNLIKNEDFGYRKIKDIRTSDAQQWIIQLQADGKGYSIITAEQQKIWMDFIQNDSTYCKHYDEFAVLLGTGMRVSEFCGLIKSDLDFKNRRISVDHQLVRERGGKYYVEKTKTECGVRFIPMTEAVYQNLHNILSQRPPKVALHIENEMRWAMKKYDKSTFYLPRQEFLLL